jgi:hypothetical protein
MLLYRSVEYTIFHIAYVVIQECGKINKPVNNTEENGSQITHSPLHATPYPSVLMADGWDGDVLSHVHLLLLVVYLTVLISCMTLILGICRVGYTTHSTVSVILTLCFRIFVF